MILRRQALSGALGALAALCGGRRSDARNARGILDPASFRHYIDSFNRDDSGDAGGFIHNAQAADWIEQQIPFLACPDRDIEATYYYRWWAFRKHIEKTPRGFVVTEFLRHVKHAAEYNAISCALGHHIAEGRWLRERRYLDDYVDFWLHGGADRGLHPAFHRYSGWLSAALYDRWLADGNTGYLVAQLDSLVTDYVTWERERLAPNGLFWQYDVADGMEESASGGRHARNLRPSINSYMYGNAAAIAAIAKIAGKPALQVEYAVKAARLRQLVEQNLWNRHAEFFETVQPSGRFADVREEIGFTPWYFNLPKSQAGYETTWTQLMDPNGFYAPYGPTTVERRHPSFRISGEGDDCQWNGPSWPFATTITLRAAAEALNRYPSCPLRVEDYFRLFLIYTRSQRLRLPGGRTIPFIDENLNPFTGEWQARSTKIRKGTFYGRGDHYNHSGYADLVITGVCGLRPRADRVIEINPLIPAGLWDWFCLDRIPYHGHAVSIIWDRTGTHFGMGSGFRVLVDGREAARSDNLGRLTGRL